MNSRQATLKETSGRKAPKSTTSAEVTSLHMLMERITQQAEEQDHICIRDILGLVGKRWYGPLLLVAGLVMMMPLVGDIPGVPVMMGLIVIFVSIQFLWKRKRVWLPSWVQERKISSGKLQKGLRFLRPSLKFVDRFTKTRLVWAVRHAGLSVIALTSMLMAAITPMLELIPFSATIAGLAIAAFGLSVLAADGVIALFAITVSLLTLVTTAVVLF